MRSVLVAALFVLSCSSDLHLPESGAPGAPSVALDPAGSLDAAPSVFRLRVRGAALRSALADFHLFTGELGAYHLGRIRARD
ncbi:MAG TPA: hypothetical protein VFZ53_26190 [Polyangiaceae bacterium]